MSGTVYGNWVVWAIHHVSSSLSRFHQMTIWGRWKAINDINITHHFLSTCILFYSWMYCKGLQFTQKIYWQTLPVKRTISFSKPNKTFLGNHAPTFKGFFSLSLSLLYLLFPQKNMILNITSLIDFCIFIASLMQNFLWLLL